MITTRRDFLKGSLALAACGPTLFADERSREKLPVAAVVTVYHKNSHADVIVGKILEGWKQDGGPGPDLKLVGMYVDQVGENDLSAGLAMKHGFQIAKTISEALTLGTERLAVSGVLIIGEHGNYETLEKTQQTLYPRRRLFDGVADTFQKCGKVVPVFSDKHLSAAWADAKHIYDRSREMKIPFMAGSSVPVMCRIPSATVPIGAEITEAVALGYGGLESYGIHTIEGMQCLMERRKGGETGVKAVQTVTGEGIVQAKKDGRWSQAVFDAVVAASPTPYAGKVPRPAEMARDAVFYLVDYLDGTKATIAMGTGFTHEFSCAVAIKGQDKPFALTYAGQDGPPFSHFEHLLRAIEHMIHTGKPAYPVERTLLTTGILDVALHSLADNGRRIETPELAVNYEPVDWPFAKGVPEPLRAS